ncbi:MAG: hypothetical protein HQL65_05020 [Magnetococcales bacterium]|nr:hypothetical protein [Magnetococcales bacterium]
MVRSREYREGLLESLQEVSEAAEYLNAALAEGDQQLFLNALKNVAEAQNNSGHLKKLADQNLVPFM